MDAVLAPWRHVTPITTQLASTWLCFSRCQPRGRTARKRCRALTHSCRTDRNVPPARRNEFLHTDDVGTSSAQSRWSSVMLLSPMPAISPSSPVSTIAPSWSRNRSSGGAGPNARTRHRRWSSEWAPRRIYFVKRVNLLSQPSRPAEWTEIAKLPHADYAPGCESVRDREDMRRCGLTSSREPG